MDIPCTKECPDRTITCHTYCEKYMAYAAWCIEQRELKQKRRTEEVILDFHERRSHAMKQKAKLKNR